MGYENPILSYENLSKAVTRRPNYLRTQFFKAAQDCDLTDGTINLLTFENWLERRIKELFKQLAEIISIQEARTKQQHPPKENFKKKIYSNFMNASDDKKESKEASEEPQKQDERKNGLTCWLCKEKHRLMDCHEFKMKPENDRIDFAAREKICKSRFSKIHLLQDCICSMKCCVDGCGKKHHTLLHLKSPHQATVNSTNKQDFTKPDQFHTFLQVIPAIVIYGAITTVVKALLNFGSDTTLITSELAKTLKLKGKQRKLNITSAISTSVSVTSNFLEFSICSAHHPDQIEVRNTWVVPSQRISKAEIQRK